MASSKAPKHDFAPAWLKIPDAETQKSSGAKQAEHNERGGRIRRDDHYGDRRYSGKNRHPSVDDDFYGNYYNPYYNNGYNSYDKYGGGHPFRSQPPVYRDGGKFLPHSGPRYPPGAMNGFPPPGSNYFDGPGYGGFNDYHSGPGDMFYNYHHPPPRPQSAAGHRRLFDSRRGNYGDRDKENKHNASNGSVVGEKKKETRNLEEEFPSLVGENEAPADTKPTKTLSNSGVWEKGPISKIKSPCNNNVPIINKSTTSPRQNGIDNPRDSVKHNTSNMYKALIPNKANGMKKGGRDINSNTSSFVTKSNRERTMSPSATIDVLNTRTVTQPRKLSDKKSDFLKQLKKENGEMNGDTCEKPADNEDQKTLSDDSQVPVEDKEEKLVNSVGDLSVEPSPHPSILSSSIEAEERLLKEMGWTEDDEEYEITEDDMQKFKSMQQLKQQNGFKRTLPKLWSPQHHSRVPIFQTPPLQDDSLSGSDDSDLDC